MLAPESNGEGNAVPAMAVLAINPVRNNAVETAARPASGGPPGNWRCIGRGGASVVYIRPPWQADCLDACWRGRLLYGWQSSCDPADRWASVRPISRSTHPAQYLVSRAAGGGAEAA